MTILSNSTGNCKSIIINESYYNSRSGVGEGIFYREEDQTLHFVDIRRHLLHRLDLTTNGEGLSEWSNHKVIETEDAVGVAVTLEGTTNQLVAAAKYGFAMLDADTGKLKYVSYAYDDKSKAERFRMNDGAVDSRGRFWAGTMRDGPVLDSPTNPHHFGSLYRLDPSGELSIHLNGTAGVPNGIGWSPDDKTMYWTDSVDSTIYAFDFSVDDGSISNKRVFVKFEIPNSTQVPDGLCVDMEGCVWTALYEGGRVLRLSPEGKVLLEVKLPAWRVSCPCFGGAEMDELFLTSIELDADDEEHRRTHGQDGNVFRLKIPGVKGIPKNKFGQKGGLNKELFRM